MSSIEALRFLTEEQVRTIAAEHGSPVFVYSAAELTAAAKNTLAFPNAYGLVVRYAMKANSNAAILQLFDRLDLHIDASSGFEAQRAMLAGIAPEKIMITAQELPADLTDLIKQGVLFNACSLHQLDVYGRSFPNTHAGIRLNPGLGSGGTERTNTGGPAASFGIWHESIDEINRIAASHSLRITRIHTHIGSGSDPAVWQKIAVMALDFVSQFPHVDTLSMGGGYKVGRMSDEQSTDLQSVGVPVRAAFEAFAKETGREITLEIEPGTYLLANAASLIATVQDTASTGPDGYEFLKLDTGMTDILRPGMYGAQHPLVTVPADPNAPRDIHDYIVVGHCCESGDILTPAPGDPEALAPRPMQQAQRGDVVVIEGAGAYCSAMASRYYNSFPPAAEVMLREDGAVTPIRRRLTVKEFIADELP